MFWKPTHVRMDHIWTLALLRHLLRLLLGSHKLRRQMELSSILRRSRYRVLDSRPLRIRRLHLYSQLDDIPSVTHPSKVRNLLVLPNDNCIPCNPLDREYLAVLHFIRCREAHLRHVLEQPTRVDHHDFLLCTGLNW